MLYFEQCNASNISPKKIEMLSPTYMEKQCLETRPEFDLICYIIIGLVTKRHMER